MVDTEFYSLIDDSADGVPPGWFDEQPNRYGSENHTLRGYLSREIGTLKSFHDGEIGCDEAAQAITRPISESPVPELGTYSDESIALVQLWRFYKDALVEWPSACTADLIKLCLAISKVPDKIHSGEVLHDDDDDEKPLTWEGLPWFGVVWTDEHWMLPEHILKKDMDRAARRQARDVYVKQQNIEAQIVAAGILDWRRACQAMAYALEREDGEDGEEEEKGGEETMVMKEKEVLEQRDFEIAATGCWIEHVGEKLYSRLAQDEPRKEPRNWRVADLGRSKRQHHFRQPLDRWDYWMDRFRVAARESLDDYTRERARATLERMERIKGEATIIQD